MSCVGRIKSEEATPSSSRKRRSPHQNGVDNKDNNKRNVSPSRTKRRVVNTTKPCGVDTSYGITTRSKQNYKNYDIGLDSLSNNNLSNNYKTATNNNKNNNVSKSHNEENNNNRSGSTLASPQRTPQNKKPLLRPNRGNSNNNSNTIQNDISPPPPNDTDILESCNNNNDTSDRDIESHAFPASGQEDNIGDSILDDDEKKRIVDELIDSLGGEKSKLKEIVPTILNHLPENQVLPIIKDVITYTANLAQHTKAPKGERKQARTKRLRNNKKLAAEARKIGDKARTKLYNLFVKLLGDEFKNRVNIERFDIEFMGFLIKHFGTQKENGNGTDDMNCHNPLSGCIKKLEKDAPTWCLTEEINASFSEGESFVKITKTRANSSTTWAQSDALFPEKASKYEEVMRFLRSNEESITLYFDTRIHALHWANKYFGNGAGVGTEYHATAVSGPPLPPHLESALPSLGLTDLHSTTLDNPNQKLTEKQKEAGVKPPPSLLDQSTVIAGKLGITVDQLLTINWAFQALQSVIFVLEHDRPAPWLIASEPATKFMIGEHIKHYGFIIRTGIVVIWRINHSQSIFEGAHLRWGEKHQHGINEAMSGFWSEVTQHALFTKTKFSTSYPPSKKAKLEEFKKAWAAVKKGDATSEQRAILEGTRGLLLHEGWKNVHLFGDLSELSAEYQDFFTNDPVGKRSWDTFEAFRELDANDGDVSKVSEESRAFLEESSFYNSMDTALTEHAKTIEQMKEDRSNYVLVGEEEIFHIPAKGTLYNYVLALRRLNKDNWKRLKFEQAAGISLSKMEFAYNQHSMVKPCAPKNIDKRLEQDKMIRALAEKNRQAAMKKRGMQQRQLSNTSGVIDTSAEAKKTAPKTEKRKRSAQKTQEEVVDKSDRPAKRQKNATVKKCVKCGMEKKKWSYLIEEWDKLEDNERVCQVCTKKTEKEGKQIARFDPAVRRELDQAVRRLEEKQAAEKKRLEQEKKAAAEVQSRLSAHQQMEQLERVAISVVRPSKGGEGT